MANWRSPRLLERVRELPCTFPFPHHPCDPATVCACHSNQLRDGKGRGIKAHDYRIAAGCFTAHYEYDQGTRYSKEEKHELFEAAHRKTVGLLFERGIVKVA